MRAVTLELAKAEDAPLLADLRVAAMRPSLEAAGRFDPERARARFMDTFDPSVTWHVLHEGQRVGVVVVRHQPDGMLLDHLYIEPGSPKFDTTTSFSAAAAHQSDGESTTCIILKVVFAERL